MMGQATLESMMAVKTRKPFHESVVDEINAARTPEQLTILGIMVIRTKIPKGHAQVREAWIDRCETLHCGANFAGQVLADIDLQERETASEVRRQY
jgi:hypothetical protein